MKPEPANPITVNGGTLVKQNTGAFGSTITGWSLNIEAVPEPTALALVGFAGLLGLTGVYRVWHTHEHL